jgi:hypothetical protein
MDPLPAPAAPAQQPADQPFLVTAQPGSPLADLLDRRDMALARQAEAEAEAKSLTAQIKNELTLACQGRTRVDIDSPRRPRMRLAWRTPRKFNRGRFDGFYPGVYEQFMEFTQGHWELGPLKRGGGR